MATDPIDPAARARLNHAMEDRRGELGLTWREVAAAAAGMTTEGIRNIRKGPSGIPPFRRRALERALQWPRYEVDRILGDPAPLPSEVPAPKEWSAEERAQWKQMSIDEIIERGTEIEAEIGGLEGTQARIRYLRAALQEKETALSIKDVPR